MEIINDLLGFWLSLSLREQGLLCGLVIAVLAIFNAMHQSAKKKSGNIYFTGDNIRVNIGLTQEKHEAFLKQVENEVRDKLSKVPLEGKEERALLERQLATITAKLANMETSHEESLKRLQEVADSLNIYKEEFGEAKIGSAQKALSQGNDEEARSLFEESLSENKERAAESAYRLGQLAERRIDLLAALKYFEQAAVLAPDNPKYLDAAGLMNGVLGRYGDAEIKIKTALDIREKSLPNDHSDIAQSLRSLARLYKTKGKYYEAEPIYKRAMKMFEHTYGPNYPNLAVDQIELGNINYLQGKDDQAEQMYKRGIDSFVNLYGYDDPKTATSLSCLAMLYQRQGKYDQAESLYNRALEINEKALGLDHPSASNIINNLGGLYNDQRKLDQAEIFYKRAIKINEKTFGPDHPEVAIGLNNLADIYPIQGKYDQAEPLFKRAIEIMEKSFPEGHPTLTAFLQNYAAVLYATGRKNEAVTIIKRAVDMREHLAIEKDSD